MILFLFTFWLDNAMVLVFLFFPLTIVVLDWPCPTLVILWNCFSTAREHQTVLDAQSCRTLCDPMDTRLPRNEPSRSEQYRAVRTGRWSGLLLRSSSFLCQTSSSAAKIFFPAKHIIFDLLLILWELILSFIINIYQDCRKNKLSATQETKKSNVFSNDWTVFLSFSHIVRLYLFCDELY